MQITTKKITKNKTKILGMTLNEKRDLTHQQTECKGCF